MKVKEYLVKRLVEVERDLENSKKNYDLLMNELRDTDARCEDYIDKLDQYQFEREHIKQIITCHLSPGGELGINFIDPDRDTLLAILDIKPEDYADNEHHEKVKDTYADNEHHEKVKDTYSCCDCKHEEQPDFVYPCCVCNEGDRYREKEDNNAEATD